MFKLKSPVLVWKDGIPSSVEYGDVYFSKYGGVDETKHVFIDGNDLTARLQRCADVGGKFIIAELGFGSGLNFCVVHDVLDSIKNENLKVEFISFEKHPLSAEDLRACLGQNGICEKFCAEFAEKYAAAEMVNGVCEVNLGKICLKLVVGDALERLAAENFDADAWFLDGFSPAKNDSMWSAALMRQVAIHTKNGGTFATYTVAKHVRERLEAAGFEIKKRRGFGRKRDMLVGEKVAR